MFTFLTAGESHGRGVFAFLDGIPAGLDVSRETMDEDLSRRQQGYGRGDRMALEKDTVDVLCGLRGGMTLGSPLILAVWNRDWENWQQFMDPWDIIPGREFFTPRPGHADLAGTARFHHRDLRNVLERASARETTARVAGGGLLRCFLARLGVEVYSWVTRIGDTHYTGDFDRHRRDASSVFCPDSQLSREMEQTIDDVRAQGDTVGGAFRVVVHGLPAGIGSYTQWNQRLDAMLGSFLFSIPGIKAVQTGSGVKSGHLFGSQMHDTILPGHPKSRGSNNAGGLEGGVSNGQPIELTCTMKPIPTLKAGLASVDLRTGTPVSADYERSDTCAVPAASVVGEAMTILAVSQAILTGFTQPSMDAVAQAFKRHRDHWESL
ncbi:MAG: chorismate synthase [Desulfomonilia bacterium]|nr:chorismate synthase [Desulfomonilia bacterium]